MILYRKYEDKKDRIWYDSSNILYSECDDNENDYKTLRVTFKNGGTYQYNKVDVNDYVAFVHGGLDGSNGKALNKIIKGKYEFEKLEPLNASELITEMERLIAKDNETANEKDTTSSL